MKQILVLTPFSPEQKTLLERQAPGCCFTYCPQGQETGEMAAKADIIIGNIDPDLLKGCGHLELLQLHSAGADAYTAPGILPAGAELTCATGAYGLAIAEHMLGALLAMKKNLYRYYDNQKKHLWRDEGAVSGIYGTRTLVIGFGNLGSEFARRMRSMGSYVVGIRRTPGLPSEFADEMHTMEALDDELARADIVALTLPGTARTCGLIGRPQLLSMKKDAFLLNNGRGSAVDLDALCEVMKDGHLAGAILDVTDPEPLPPEHPFWDLPNAILTPHVSGDFNLPKTLDLLAEIAAENLRRHLCGEPLKSAVDLTEGYRRAER